MFCHLDISVSCSVVLLFIKVYGNNVSVNFYISTYILNIHLLIYYIAYKDILSTSLMFMGENSFLSSKKSPSEFLFSVSSKIYRINYSGGMKINTFQVAI